MAAQKGTPPKKTDQTPMRYWALVMFREAGFQAQRFDKRGEAIAYAQVHARLPDARYVSVDVCGANGNTPIWEWGDEVEEEERRH